ncbi:hypothetical protein PM082_011236 [Marasmius tenuissimus]|nr:hypothetical protein PM082_011236 [Marasmius tenuissimus]
MLIRVPQSNGANSHSPFLHPQSEGLTGYMRSSVTLTPSSSEPGCWLVAITAPNVYGRATGLLWYLSSSFGFQTGVLSKAMANVGLLDSGNLLCQAQATEVGEEVAMFTSIGNSRV